MTGASEKRLLREVAALRSRLAEASAEHMSRHEFPLEAPDSSPSAARAAVSGEALNSSDRRLEALQAEAHLLQDSLDGALPTSSASATIFGAAVLFSSLQHWKPIIHARDI